MTDLLRDVLAGVADESQLPDVDQEEALRASRTRLRNRRRRVAVGVGAAALCVAVAVPVAFQTLDTDSAEPAGPDQVQGNAAFAERKPTYAVGSEIHYGDAVISVAPHSIKAFVQTDDGFAFVSGDEVYFTDGGPAIQIGVGGAPYGQLLAADDRGSRVAWVDLSTSGKAVYQAYDTATGHLDSLTKPHTAGGEFDVPSIAAVDGSDVYAWSDAGFLEWRLGSGDAPVIKAGVNDQWLLDVADGWLAYDDSDPEGGGIWGDDLVIAKAADATTPRYPSGRVDFSPNATYFANDHDDSEQIIARDGGAVVTPDHRGYSFMALIQWIDEDRFTAVGVAGNDDETFDLLECSISGATCAPAVRGLEIGSGLALPVGSEIDN